jgi:cytochrome bd-type quinol oxidase subunit 2
MTGIWFQNKWQKFNSNLKATLASISLIKFLSEFLLIIFFTILPTLIVALWVPFTTGKAVDPFELLKAGEFLLYAVSFFSSALVAMTNRQFARNDWRELIKRILIIPIVIVSLLYTAVFVTKGNVNRGILELTSYISMGLSFMLFFLAQFWGSQASVDVHEERNSEQQDIMEHLS